MSSALHPDGKANPSQASSNTSGNVSIHELIEARKISRRDFLKGSFGVTAVALFGGSLLDGFTQTASAAGLAATGKIGFTSVPANIVPMKDGVTVPIGYSARVLLAWGDSLTLAPHWNPAGEMTEAIQRHTYGAHNDGMQFFPFPPTVAERVARGQRKQRGLFVVNHEYADPGLVNSTLTYATDTLTLAKVRAQQAAHGVSVVELRKSDQWAVQRASTFNRRITGNTRCKISGPAAGHALMRTAADPSGKEVLGTLNNCSNGATPWGTYLTCEENFNGYFGTTAAFTQTDVERRYGLRAEGFGYRWHEVDPRFDLAVNRNEPHRFGWVVEIDPFHPGSPPIKRTALGRFKHESAMTVVGSDNAVCVYMGDDERNDYLYKFVCAKKYHPRHKLANRKLLDSGTLYTARFNADGSGEWLPLLWNQNGLTAAHGFADQGEVLIKARQAADRLGATMMDRPEWIAAHPVTREIYLTLTNNNRRSSAPESVNAVDGTTSAGNARPPVDTVNPRADNLYGHIIRWRERGGDVAALHFEWNIFAQCGDKLDAQPNHQGNIKGDDYGAPDGLWFDRDGRLWVQTDQQGDGVGDWANIGGNVMMCVDTATGETRRFMTSPKNCEVTGVVATPDGKTLFVGIQHPGEDWKLSFTSQSTWPDSGINGATTASFISKPRSATVVITKDDGGVIGT